MKRLERLRANLARWLRSGVVIIWKEWSNKTTVVLVGGLLSIPGLSLYIRIGGVIILLVLYLVLRIVINLPKGTAVDHQNEPYWFTLQNYLNDTEEVLARFVIENDPFFLRGGRVVSDTESDIDRAQYVTLAASLLSDHLHHRYTVRGGALRNARRTWSRFSRRAQSRYSLPGSQEAERPYRLYSHSSA
jgi:hypothetical protein